MALDVKALRRGVEHGVFSAADILEALDRLERAEAVCVAAADCGGTGGVVHRWDAGDSALQRLSVAVARWREVAKP